MMTWVAIVRDALTRAQKWNWADSAEGIYTRRRSVAARGLPYCLHATALPDVRCVVNRRYRHVGSPPDTRWSDYEAATGWHVSRACFERLRDAGAIDERGYFFSDTNRPWKSRADFNAYRAKIETLLALFA